jgi:hypothetical protein
MCRQKKCKNCNKITWAGCGNHVDAVMKGVADKDKCKCSSEKPSNSKGFFSKIFGAK